MARIQYDFEKHLRLVTADLEPASISRELAAFARKSVSEVIASGEASPNYDKFVDGRLGAEEETVRPDGVVLYDFLYWQNIIEYALQYLVQRSPRGKSGKFSRSWHVLANGAPVSNWRNIDLGAVVHVVNAQPYSRKIETGFMATSGFRATEDARRAVMSIFGNLVTTRAVFIELPSGPSPAPYTLRGRFKRGAREFSRRKLRRDTSSGAMMTYPSVRIEMRRRSR